VRTRYADGRVIGPGFWLWLSAIAIGVFLACWSVQGQPAEGMWGRGEIGIVGMTGDVPTFTLTVKQHDTYDPKGIQFYELRFQDGSAVTISGDADVPFVQALQRAQGKQRLTLEAWTLQDVGR
jgi:hypothetical protein